MVLNCGKCGRYEIAPELIDEILELPSMHWQVVLLREGLEKANSPVKISKTASNIAEVIPLDKKMTKIEKWSLRKQAEEGPKIAGHIYFTGIQRSDIQR